MDKESKNSLIISALVVFSLVLICCVSIFICNSVFQFFQTDTSKLISIQKPSREISTPVSYPSLTVEAAILPESESPTNLKLIDNGAIESLIILQNTTVPEKNILDLTQRLKNRLDISPAPKEPAHEYKLGDSREFWVLNTNDDLYHRVIATLHFITDHLYFWIQEGIAYNKSDLEKLSLAFEYEIYPTVREFFGSELSSGIDNDPHVLILYTHGLGGAAGFFSSSDTVSPDIDQYSNFTDMFYLSADYATLDEDSTYGILAHEFQHMLQWFHDHNETSWMSEGFSELATYLSGYGMGGFDNLFSYNPDIQLTDWPDDNQGNSSPHYGAAFMFLKYFLDRFGENATKALVMNPANDMNSIDKVLDESQVKDYESKNTSKADELFRDWTITNFLQDGKLIDNRYGYKQYSPPVFSPTELIIDDSDWQERDVKQYGTDYIEIKCKMNCSLEIDGQNTTRILPVGPYSGDYYFWSNKGDESDMTLSQTFDFTNIKGSISLQYFTWFDIEKDYDYVYLLATLDDNSWKILRPARCSESNPTGANYGCGYTGKSNGWVQENVDLSQFAGKRVKLQFEYITDLAINGEGFLLDYMTIPEIGYQTDFEDNAGGWSESGFTRIQNKLPQTYLLTLITREETSKIQPLIFDQDQQIRIPLEFSDGAENIVLVVSGTTRYTRIPAYYRYRVIPSQ